jgi:hypothetical protein
VLQFPCVRFGQARHSAVFHGRLGQKFHTVDKANAIADCLENQFTPLDMCDENYERRVKARVQALFEAEDNDRLNELDHVTYRN